MGGFWNVCAISANSGAQPAHLVGALHWLHTCNVHKKCLKAAGKSASVKSAFQFELQIENAKQHFLHEAAANHWCCMSSNSSAWWFEKWLCMTAQLHKVNLSCCFALSVVAHYSQHQELCNDSKAQKHKLSNLSNLGLLLCNPEYKWSLQNNDKNISHSMGQSSNKVFKLSWVPTCFTLHAFALFLHVTRCENSQKHILQTQMLASVVKQITNVWVDHVVFSRTAFRSGLLGAVQQLDVGLPQHGPLPS
jgi:hypothetical protein